MRSFRHLAILMVCLAPCAFAQSHCAGSPLSGVVRDTTAALVPGTSVALDGDTPILSGSDGSFRFPCVLNGNHVLHISSPSFASLDLPINAPHKGSVSVVLHPEGVQTSVEVEETTVEASSPTSTGASQTIAGKQLQSLADDPDDLLRQLQQLGATAGAMAGNTRISVDGFQNGDGTTPLPPKSSIAYIEVNPDLFSAEYREPPFGGGQIKVYTKPGQSTFHGALFATNSSSWMNARDPFTVSRAALGRQRYGFEFNGPIQKKGSDFALTLEHRQINNFAAVDAITVDAADNPSHTLQNVPAPQSLWVGLARSDWQLGPRNTFIATLNSYTNQSENVGVGGTSLPETGYGSLRYDYTLHFTDVTTFSPRLMHEHRLSVDWDGEDDTPVSTAPQVQVAGAFTGGGATVGPQRLRELEIDDTDDEIISTSKHLLKIALDSDILDEHKRLTTNFNGTYSFGGGVLPGTNTPITGLRQYQLALNGAPGGAPTAYSNVAGNPEVDFTEVRFDVYFQDDWKIRQNLHFAYGLRYFVQTDPTVLDSITPRFGLAWSPDKKATWSLHAHAGMFSGIYRTRVWGEIERMDGTQRVSSTIYTPSCSGIDNSGCTPFTNATPIHSIRAITPSFPNIMFAIENAGATHSFAHGWNVAADYYIAQIWHDSRSENINSPLNGSPTGTRPLGPNLNILQVQASGRGWANVESFTLEQHTLKRLQFSAGAVRVDVVDDTDDNPFSTPQTTGVNTGEYARRTGNGLWNIFGNATFTLPAGLQLSGFLTVNGDAAYNITTGFDNNGDGDFNDRPQYAQPGTPGAVQTPWGLLVSSGGTGSLPRNKGVMPWQVYFDSNLQRTFKLTENAKAAHPQAIVANIRSSNVLNHTNVTQVGGVLGSPLFGVAYAADNGRRFEGGIRYMF